MERKIIKMNIHNHETLLESFVFNGIDVELVQWHPSIWCGCVQYAVNHSDEPDVEAALTRFVTLPFAEIQEKEKDWDVCLSLNYLSKSRPNGVMFGFRAETEQQPDCFDVIKLPKALYMRIKICDATFEALGVAPWTGGIPPYEWIGEVLAPKYGYTYGDDSLPIFEYYLRNAVSGELEASYLYVPVQKMKKLPFYIPFTGFSDLDFISVLSSVTLYLEGVVGADGYDCPKEADGNCTGCGNCKNSLDNIKEQTYFLLDTMCGRSSLRCRFDGTQTEMQEWIDEKDGCGSADNIDFLFGFIGYDYRIVTDRTAFSGEIRQSLENSRPVLARVNGSHGRFRVIIGQDGDKLFEPNYKTAQNLPENGITYGDIQCLYIIGEKISRRFTENDGLKRIEKIMEYNDNAGLWDEYQQKMGWYGGMDCLAPEERAVRMKRTADTMWHTFNSHNFAEVFRNRITDELKKAEYDEMQNIINPSYGYTHDLAWSLIGLSDDIDWVNPRGNVCGYAEAVQLILWRIQQNDRDLLAAVKRALGKVGNETAI